jgi:hypothetical protein
MISPDIKDLFEALSYLATLLGIPVAIAIFVIEKRRERIEREQEIHAAANDRYIAYLTLCLEHPELDAFDFAQDDPSLLASKVPYRTTIAFTILISMLENAFLRYRHGTSTEARSQWLGWRGYMSDWASRPSFRKAWAVVGDQFSPAFVAEMQSIVDQHKTS